MGKKKFTHSHETHHEGSKVERWLSRETHKWLAELAVLVLAAYIAEGTMHSIAEVVRRAVA